MEIEQEVVEIDDPTKLTDWENEPKVSDLKQNIDDAEADQTTHSSNVDRWLENMVNARPKVTGRSSVSPKLIRKQAEWRYSSLSEPFLSTPDLFNVYPTTAGDRNRAKQNELILNKQFNTQLKKVDFIDAYIREGVDVGTVFIKTGWESYEEEVTETVPVYDYTLDLSGQLAEKYTALLQLKQQNNEGYMDHSTPGLDRALQIFTDTGQAYFAEEVGEKEITSIKETKNQPTLEIPDSRNIIVDPACNGDMSKASFIGEKFKSSLAALKRDGKYVNLDQIRTTEASPLANPDYEENVDIETFSFKDTPRKQFVVFSYWGEWDIHGDGVMHQIIASWVEDTLIRLDLNPFPDRKPPFVKVVYMPVRRSVFGEPDGELLEDNQEIIGAVTRGTIDLLGRSANSQIGTQKGFLDVTNSRRFKRGEDYEFNSNINPDNGVHMHKFPEVPRSAYDMISMQNAEAESLTGVKAFSSGISGQSLGSVATGVRGALDAASKRELGILRRFAAGIVDIGYKFISMNSEFLSEKEVVRVTNEEFIQVRRDDLAGSFDLRLSISTAEEDNKKAEELAMMLQTLGPNQDPGITKMIQSDIARLRKMPDLAQRIEDYQPEPDPMAVMKAELEIKLLEAQIAKERALAAKHGTEAQANGMRGNKDGTQAQLNQAKAGTEVAKARNLGSDSDNKDLTFIQNEQGTAHQQDMEKLNTKSVNDAATQIGLKEME